MLLSVLLALIVLGPFAGGPVEAPDASVLLSVVAPAFYVIMLFVLPLDITMSSVFMSDKQGEERARFRFIIRTEVAFFVVMLLAWLPFVIRLLKSVF